MNATSAKRRRSSSSKPRAKKSRASSSSSRYRSGRARTVKHYSKRYRLARDRYRGSTQRIVGSKNIPRVTGSSGVTTIRHREYIQDVTSSTNFNVTTLVINPGQQYTFPWLSTLAQNFTTYKFKRLIFEFISTCGDALSSTNSALGTVVLAVNYNVNAINYPNKQAMESAEFAVSGKPSQNMVCKADVDHKMISGQPKYIRTGLTNAVSDARWYDIGDLGVGTVGSQASFDCGELWVSYEIELYQPQLIGALGESLQGSHFSNRAPVGTVGPCTGSNPLGGSFLYALSYYNDIGVTYTGNTITFPLGCQGIWCVTLVGSLGTADTSSFVYTGTSTTGSVNQTNLVLIKSSNTYGPLTEVVIPNGVSVVGGTAVGSTFSSRRHFLVTDPAKQMIIQLSVANGTTFGCDVYIQQLPLNATIV